MADEISPGKTVGFAGDGRFSITVKVSVSSAMVSLSIGMLMHCLLSAPGPKTTEKGPAE